VAAVDVCLERSGCREWRQRFAGYVRAAGRHPRKIQSERRDGCGYALRLVLRRESALSIAGVALALLAGGFNMGQLGGFPLLILMFVAMYFLLIAPNQKKQKTWAAMLAALKAGDRVTTNGGIRGTILSVKDDVLVVKTAPDGVRLEIVKSAIAAVTRDEDSVKA